MTISYEPSTRGYLTTHPIKLLLVLRKWKQSKIVMVATILSLFIQYGLCLMNWLSKPGVNGQLYGINCGMFLENHGLHFQSQH